MDGSMKYDRPRSATATVAYVGAAWLIASRTRDENPAIPQDDQLPGLDSAYECFNQKNTGSTSQSSGKTGKTGLSTKGFCDKGRRGYQQGAPETTAQRAKHEPGEPFTFRHGKIPKLSPPDQDRGLRDDEPEGVAGEYVLEEVGHANGYREAH